MAFHLQDTKARKESKLTKVLKGSLLLAALDRLAVHEVVEALAALEEVVDTTHDTEDTGRVDPDTDNGDNGGVAVLEPTPDGEAGGDDVDNENGTGELPRGEGRPERSVGTGDENEPVLSEGDLEEENGIHVTEVLDDTTVGSAGSVHGGKDNPGTDGEDNTEKDGHTPELGKVPLDGGRRVGSVVVGDGQGGNIGENGDEDNKVNVERPVQDDDPEAKEDLKMDGQGDTVDDVSVHAVENLARSLESVDNGTETGGKEHNIGSRSGSVRGTLDSNTSIGLLERGSIVDTVTSHGNEVTTLLKNLDDIVLVLGEDLGETIGSLDEIVDLGTGHVTTTTETETLSIVDVGAETELARGFAGNTDGITSQHLDGETKALGFVNGAGGIVTRGVRAGHDAENLPRALTSLAGDTKRTETTGGELGDLVLVGLVDLLGDGVVLLDCGKNEEGGTLDTGDALALRRLDNGGNLLGDGVEGVELKHLVLAENALGTGVVAEGLEESLVDGVNTLLLAGSGQAGSQHEVIGVNTGDGVGLRERKLVLGEGTSLVRAENLDTGKRLNGRELLDDSLLLGEVGSTDSHGGGNDGGKTDGDTNDSDGKGELKNGDNADGSVERGNPDHQVGQDDKNEEHGTNAVENLSEVTSTGRSARDKGGGATNEGAVTSGGNDDEGLTTLDGGRSIAGVTIVLVDGERFTSNGGLINLEEGLLGDDATISGDNSTLCKHTHVSICTESRDTQKTRFDCSVSFRLFRFGSGAII